MKNEYIIHEEKELENIVFVLSPGDRIAFI
jgi:hypothetical protein